MATTTTETGAGTETHGGSKNEFPPMDTSTFPSQLFWLVIFFSALYLLMSRFALPRLASIIDGRKAKIDGDISHAQALRDQTESAMKAYETSLTQARGKATDIAKQTRDAVNKDVDAEQHKLDESLSSKLRDAEARIAKGKAKAMESISDIASESAAEIVAALGGGKVTKAAITKALKG